MRPEVLRRTRSPLLPNGLVLEIGLSGLFCRDPEGTGKGGGCVEPRAADRSRGYRRTLPSSTRGPTPGEGSRPGTNWPPTVPAAATVTLLTSYPLRRGRGGGRNCYPTDRVGGGGGSQLLPYRADPTHIPLPPSPSLPPPSPLDWKRN